MGIKGRKAEDSLALLRVRGGSATPWMIKMMEEEGICAFAFFLFFNRRS